MDYEHLYPESARGMLGHVDDVIHTHGTDMSEAGIARMSDDLARRSMTGGSLSGGHNSGTLNDLARLLILQRLFEQGGVPIFPYSPFFVWPPFVPMHRTPVHRLPIRPSHPIHPPMRPR